MSAKWNRVPRNVFGWKGDTGSPGTNGNNGISVSSGLVNGEGHLILTLSDNSTVDVGTVIGPEGDPGTAGAAATISIGTITTGAAGSSATVTNSGTSSAAVFDFTIPKGADGEDGTGTGDMLAATYDPIIKAITGESTVGATPDTTLAALWAQPWTLPCVLNKPADAYVSFSLPLSRNATMTSMDFYCTGTPSASTNIVVKQNGTTVGTVAISAAGKTTLTFSTAVTGTLDDVFTYTVSGAGLAACTVTANMKWVNR